MNRRYWEAMAAKWSDEMFDTYHEDRAGALLKVIRSRSGSDRTLIDFGCGVGTAIPTFAPAFGRVVGLDWAMACVRKARTTTAHLRNVRVDRASPSILATLRECADVTLAVQVAISPSPRARSSVLSRAVSVTKRDGTLVVVVPSLESLVLVDFVSRTAGRKWSLPFSLPASMSRTEPWVVELNGQPTKHFGGEELVAALTMLGCEPVELRRVAFSWSIYGARPPSWLGAVTPWDWLLVAKPRESRRDGRVSSSSARRSAGR